jgi:hypothetical protein
MPFNEIHLLNTYDRCRILQKCHAGGWFLTKPLCRALYERANLKYIEFLLVLKRKKVTEWKEFVDEFVYTKIENELDPEYTAAVLNLFTVDEISSHMYILKKAGYFTVQNVMSLLHRGFPLLFLGSIRSNYSQDDMEKMQLSKLIEQMPAKDHVDFNCEHMDNETLERFCRLPCFQTEKCILLFLECSKIFQMTDSQIDIIIDNCPLQRVLRSCSPELKARFLDKYYEHKGVKQSKKREIVL